MATEAQKAALLDVFVGFCGPDNADKGQVQCYHPLDTSASQLKA